MANNERTLLRLLHPRRVVAGAMRRLLVSATKVRTAFGRARAAASHRWIDARNSAQLRRALQSTPRPELLLGVPNEDALPVIVCLWNRPHRIDAILEMLDSQDCESRLRLMLWNNQPHHSRLYRDAVRTYRSVGQIDSVEFLESRRNIGGIARFVAARHLVEEGYRGPFVMLDDDQDVTPQFISDLLAVAGPRTVAGIWAWHTGDTYWQRERANAEGQVVDYVGTGGCVCDSELVAHDEFFDAIPPKYMFLEDMWMSWLAAANGWRVISADTPITFVDGEHNQYHGLIALKNEFYAWLRTPGHLPQWTDR